MNVCIYMFKWLRLAGTTSFHKQQHQETTIQHIEIKVVGCFIVLSLFATFSFSISQDYVVVMIVNFVKLVTFFMDYLWHNGQPKRSIVGAAEPIYLNHVPPNVSFSSRKLHHNEKVMLWMDGSVDGWIDSSEQRKVFSRKVEQVLQRPI